MSRRWVGVLIALMITESVFSFVALTKDADPAFINSCARDVQARDYEALWKKTALQQTNRELHDRFIDYWKKIDAAYGRLLSYKTNDSRGWADRFRPYHSTVVWVYPAIFEKNAKAVLVFEHPVPYPSEGVWTSVDQRTFGDTDTRALVKPFDYINAEIDHIVPRKRK